MLLFFAALFVVTHGVAQAGIAERLFRWLEPAFGSDALHQTFRFGAFRCSPGTSTPAASVADLIVLELAKIPFLRFLAVGAGATFLPLAGALATLLVERRIGLLSR